MKILNKIGLVALTIITATISSGCGYKNDMSKGYTFSSTKIAKEYNMISAKDIAERYVENMVNGEYSENSILFTENLKKREQSKEYNKNFIVTGYDAEKVNEFPSYTEFVYNLSRCDLERPYATLEEIKVKVINDKEEYKIDKVESTIIREAYTSGENVRVRSEDNVESYLVIGKNSIPKYVGEDNNPLSLQKLFVDNNKLQLLNFDYSGDHISIVSKGSNAMVSSILIDQSEMALAKKEPKEGQKESEEVEESIEKPVGKKVEVLKVLKNAKVDFCSYSRDNLYLITQYVKNNNTRLMINDIEYGKPIELNFDEKFSTDKFNIEYLNVTEKGVKFKVYGKKHVNLDDKDKELVGSYQVEFIDADSLEKIS